MHTDGIWFKDDEGCTLILRGVNLGGSSKVPYSPNGATYRRENFFEYRQVSFVGRPFPISEADEHFSRLREWGLTFLRFLVTWEAVEHAGPEQYDEKYLDYLYDIIKKAGDYGLNVFVDPHQDVWSRWTGGDGAPGWTLEAVGMDPRKLSATGAAINHQEYGDPFPRMIWPSNYTKLGAATLFTLFFGGHDFAPGTKIEGVPVQEFLQGHYINAIKQIAMRLKDLSNVVGYDTLNEPGSGFIGIDDIGSQSRSLLRRGPSPTPFQAMLLGAGYPQEIDLYELGMSGLELKGSTVLNPDSITLWREGYDCIWKQNGIWTDEGGEPLLLRPGHFAEVNGEPVDFANDYLKPFILRYSKAIREVHPGAIIFLGGTPMGHGDLHWGPEDPTNVVNADHWYDGMTLMTKRFNPQFNLDLSSMKFVQGEEAVRKLFVRQVAEIKRKAKDKMGNIPTLIGEFGLPFDLDDKAAYEKGDFKIHVRALNAYYHAMDTNLLSCTIWNYTADNTNERGDMWNDEDLSIFSRDQQDNPNDIHSGGRGLEAIVRPYATKIAGEPLNMQFDPKTRVFKFEFHYDSNVGKPTEIYVPNYQYPKGYKVEIFHGSYIIDSETQTLRVESTSDQTTQRVTIGPI